MQEDGFDTPPWTSENLDREDLLSITYEETDKGDSSVVLRKARFTETNPRGREFRDAYKEAYRRNRRATTPGAVETLVRPRENGYWLAIVTNGQIVDQEEKAKAIGVRHLVGGIFTSERVGSCKPDSCIFQHAINASGSYPGTHIVIVGDSIYSDIKEALNTGLSAILYSLIAQEL